MAWQEMFRKAMCVLFVVASVTCVVGCAVPNSGSPNPAAVRSAEQLEIVKKGEPAPGDGFWLSRRTFLMLYKAAETSTVSPDVVSQQNAPNRIEPPADDTPSTAGGAPEPGGKLD